MARKVRAMFDPSEDEGIKCTEPGARQSEKDACDVNKILAKYATTGILEHVMDVQAKFGDFSNIDDYATNLNKIIAADNAFAALPAETRKRFGNDPTLLMEFLADKKNDEEAIKLGLVKQPQKQGEPVEPPKPKA